MTSKNKTLSIDDKVWRCIRRYKRFRFSEVLLITGATQEYLSDLIQGYEAEGIIKLKDDRKAISEREYRVLEKLDLNVGVIYHSSRGIDKHKRFNHSAGGIYKESVDAS